MISFIFDTETSGLVDNHLIPLAKQPEVIEFYGALVNLETGEIKREIDTLIKPERELPDEHIKHTPITNAMLVNAPSFNEVASAIKEAIEGSPAVIAHNLSFDMEIMDLEYERLESALVWPRRRICTVEATIHIKGFRLGLTPLHELLFGEKFPEAHRAKPDTAALIRCAVELFKRGEL